MKSITTKLRCWLATLLLGFFSMSAFAQTVGVPTQQEVNALLASQESQFLTNYFVGQGYTNGGVVPGSAKTYETEIDRPAGITASISGSSVIGAPIKIKIKIVIVIIIIKKAGAESVYQSITSEKQSYADGSGTPLVTNHAVGENTTTNFLVSGGTVRSVPKSSMTGSMFASGNGGSSFSECWAEALLGTATNCTGCYNCLKDCLTGTGLFGNKLLCCLTKCTLKCVLCVTSIFKLYKCYTS
jgi:hypothetical protein